MSEKTKTRARLRNLVALSIIPGLGQRRVRQLYYHFGEDLVNIFNLGKSKIKSVEGIGEASALSILSFDKWEEADKLIEQTEESGSELITIADPEYPELLRQIYDPPVLLWIKGNTEALSQKGIAVVGTRHPTGYGKKMTRKLVEKLTQQGLCIFSGLAYGIDALAHKTALENNGLTVGVLGSGIDNLYPRENVDIANAMVKSGGAVITEFPPGTNPDAGNFPVRNRIVSGLSLGVLVMESGLQGGSMITADLGLDQNREVFTVPHSLENLSGTGCNYLIKRGAAKLVQTVDDILEELPVERIESGEESIPQKTGWRELDLDDLSRKICELLEEQACQIDDMGDKLGENTSRLLVALLQLEMQEVVLQKAGKVFELK